MIEISNIEELNEDTIKSMTAQEQESANEYIECIKKQAFLEGYSQGYEDGDRESLERIVEKLSYIKDESVNGEYTHNRVYRTMIDDFISTLNGTKEIERTIFGCVDCDVCEHRSETSLCDISSNDENCPLVDDGK